MQFKTISLNRICLTVIISINGYNPSLAAINCRIFGGSVLGLFLFLLYIINLNQAIKFWKVHHLTKDTNLLCLSNYIKDLNKQVNVDLRHLVNWLNTNKFTFNGKKLKW